MKKQSGFTLIEVLVVLAIVTVVYLFSSFIFTQRQPYVDLDMASSDLLSVLRTAQNQSISGKASSTWGVYFDDNDKNKYILYAGLSYNTRETSLDLIYNMSEAINWSLDSDNNDINFRRDNGFSSATSTIEIFHSGLEKRGIITINEIAKIERDE